MSAQSKKTRPAATASEMTVESSVHASTDAATPDISAETDLPLTDADATDVPDIPALLARDALERKKPWQRRLDKFRAEYGYLFLTALIPAVIVYLLYLVRGLHPFGDGCVLVLDLNGQYVSFYEALHDILHGDADLLYSFSRNLGGEFLGIYDYYVASPFAAILWFFPERRMLEGLLVLFMLKAALCGLFMGIYLHKHSAGEPNRLTIVAFSLMYALCAYCIIQQHNSMWIDAVLWLPLLALGIESLIRYGKFRLYVVALAFTLWSNFYIGYMVVIFTILYCFYDYFAHNQNGENNPMGEKGHLPKSIGRVLLWSVLAVGIAALVILSARYSLSFGKDDFSDPNWEITQKFELFEFLYKFLPSSYDTVRNSGRPFVYCGILTVMLVPAYFMSKKFSTREKIASALFILVFVASFATSSIDLIWHGFQKPNWLPYRYSFMLSFFLLTLAYRAFDQIQFTSKKALLGVVAIIGMYVVLLPEFADYFICKDAEDVSIIHTFATVWLSLGCLAVYFILISLYSKCKGRMRETVSVVMVFVVCVELFLSAVTDMNSFGEDVGYSKYSRYNNMIDTFRPIAYLVQENDAGFYRMEKTYERKTNDNFALQMKGLSLSTSTLNRETIDFLERMGYDSTSHNSHYKGGTPINDSLLGIKYLITDEDMTVFYGDPVYTCEDYGYDEDYEPLDDYDVYQNPYALSLIYGVADAWLDYDPSAYVSPFDHVNAMITAMLGEEETVEVFVPAVQNGEPILNNVEKTSPYNGHIQYKVVDPDVETSTLTYNITVPVDTYVYFYYPADYARKVKVKANGKSVGSFEEYMLSLGTSATGDMEVEVDIDNTSNNVRIKEEATHYFYYLDWDVFEDVMARLAETQVTIDEGYTDSHLFGSVTTATDGQLMFTSIPWDEGWQISVDGEAVELHKTADALISFYVEEAGEHRIELRYMPRVVSLGLAITIVSSVIFLLVLLLYPFMKRIPILRGIVHIQGEEQPALATPEYVAGIEEGDFGDEDT